MTHAINRRSFLKSGTLAGAAAMCGLPEVELRALEAESAEAPKFQKAVPLWQKGREEEMNVSLVFYASFKIDDDAIEGAILRSTGSSAMRIMLDGKHFGYGPARGPHGWFRVDEWDLSKRLTKGSHFLTIEVAGYNSNSFYLLDQPSFLQAEVVDGNGKTIAATLENGEDGVVSFQAVDYTGIRVQKVQRFSFQRPFIEVYNLKKFDEMENVELAKQPDVNYLPRRVPYPEFAVIEPVGYGKTGKVVKREKLENPWRDRSLVNIGPELKGYKMDELEVVLSDEVQALETTFDENAKPLEIGATYTEGDCQIIDFC
ncbi:MAG: twin-arginine translocation signal domain-containing protein, partial [Thermoguttaceae bacterium]|nr:twin-arginine translocation signal domain-containing protein [Thermoguttaceae bacterium]